MPFSDKVGQHRTPRLNDSNDIPDSALTKSDPSSHLFYIHYELGGQVKATSNVSLPLEVVVKSLKHWKDVV